MRNWRLALLLLSATLVQASPTAGQATPTLSGVDFIIGARALVGQVVTVSDCSIGGTAAGFIRCETPNGAASYSLDTDGMDPASLRFALTTCPTGSARKAACRGLRVRGRVRRAGSEPILAGVTILTR